MEGIRPNIEIPSLAPSGPVELKQGVEVVLQQFDWVAQLKRTIQAEQIQKRRI